MKTLHCKPRSSLPIAGLKKGIVSALSFGVARSIDCTDTRVLVHVMEKGICWFECNFHLTVSSFFFPLGLYGELPLCSFGSTMSHSEKYVQWKNAISTATWTEGSTWLLISSHHWPVDPWSSFRRVPKSSEAFCLFAVPLYLSASKFILDTTDLTWSRLLCNKTNLFAPCHGVSNSDLMVFAAQRQGFAGSAPLETEKIPPSKHGHCQIMPDSLLLKSMP